MNKLKSEFVLRKGMIFVFFQKIVFKLSGLVNFVLNQMFGVFSVRRRMRQMPLFPVNNNLLRLNLDGKRILLVVTHCDDEVIWASTLLTNDNMQKKDLVVIYDGGEERNEIIKQVALLSRANLDHLKIFENVHPYSNTLAFVESDAEHDIRDVLEKKIELGNYDYIFTHNEFGEYGHGQHRNVHEIVKSVCLKIGFKGRLLFFGYAPTLMYANGKTYWPDTLKAFGINCPWRKKTSQTVKPFFGIFKSKQYNEYFWHETKYYLPQLNKDLVLKLVNLYSRVESAWVNWKRKGSYYYEYLNNHVQYFTDSNITYGRYINYEWPNFGFCSLHPRRKNWYRISLVDDIRHFLNNYLFDYIHLEGKVLWVGWNMFCVKSHYLKKMNKFADQVDLLDNNPTRGDKKIYGSQTANIVADVCNLKEFVSNNTYDGIYLNGVLEYVDSVESALAECSRVLKNKGRILVGLPGVDWEITGKNRVDFDEVINLLKKYNLYPLEVWRKYNPDYYYIHCIKSGIN